MDELISRSALLAEYDRQHEGTPGRARKLIEKAPAVDAVEMNMLKNWLYKIAMTTPNNYLCDACERIISNLDGLRVFARERKENETD